MTPKNEPITHRADDDGAALYFVRTLTMPPWMRIYACGYQAQQLGILMVADTYMVGRHTAQTCGSAVT